MPSLCRLYLPPEGLGQESVEAFERFKAEDLKFKYKLQKCGLEFQELQRATWHYLRKGCEVTASLCREGILLQLQITSLPRRELRAEDVRKNARLNGIVIGARGKLDPIHTRPFPTNINSLPVDAEKFLIEQTKILEETKNFGANFFLPNF